MSRVISRVIYAMVVISAPIGAICSAAGGNICSAAGGNICTAAGGNICTATGGNVCAATRGNICSATGGNVCSATRGNICSATRSNECAAAGVSTATDISAARDSICGHGNRKNQHEHEKNRINWLFHLSHPFVLMLLLFLTEPLSLSTALYVQLKTAPDIDILLIFLTSRRAKG
jgi:hypothetical protein